MADHGHTRIHIRYSLKGWPDGPHKLGSLSKKQRGALPFITFQRQYPVRLAFAMTINKSQGQYLGIVGMNLHTPVFSYGQCYVAVSRGTSWGRTKVLLPEEAGGKTENIVYPDVLLYI